MIFKKKKIRSQKVVEDFKEIKKIVDECEQF
jgi:hypothetical protein